MPLNCFWATKHKDVAHWKYLTKSCYCRVVFIIYWSITFPKTFFMEMPGPGKLNQTIHPTYETSLPFWYLCQLIWLCHIMWLIQLQFITRFYVLEQWLPRCNHITKYFPIISCSHLFPLSINVQVILEMAFSCNWCKFLFPLHIIC